MTLALGSPLEMKFGTQTYSLCLTCESHEVDRISGELWEAGSSGLQEIDCSDGKVQIKAGFEHALNGSPLLQQFQAYSPEWTAEPARDWVEETRVAWPGRVVGRSFFLAPPWLKEETPAGRRRIVHNPGMACGTGEHPCTQLALEALEECVVPGAPVVADIGTGSGLLAVAAWLLGAQYVVGVDPDEEALGSAQGNLQRNACLAGLAAGSADSLAEAAFDIVVANINASVLLAIADDLLRIAKPGGTFILTGFSESESRPVAEMFPPRATKERSGWSCLISGSS